MKLKLVVLALGIVWASQAAADTFNQFVSFGDSTLDSGWWSGALQGQCDGASSPCTTGSTPKNTLIANAIALGGGVTGAPVGVGLSKTTAVIMIAITRNSFFMRRPPLDEYEFRRGLCVP